jgi:predicted lysophospholipase L1 biosynthesis ABC-type transport system permease subunit
MANEISETHLSLWDLVLRIVRYTNRHLQHNRRRSLLPIATIATGTLLIYAVLTLTATVQAQMAQMSGTLSPETAEAIARGTVYIAFITLAVGALETAVVMTRSVLSRVQEIGILKATGVKDTVIFSLFIAEAFLYGVVGGLAGIVLGWAIVAVVQMLDGTSLALALLPSWKNGLIAAGLAIVVSIVTAFLPIWQTVRMSAIQALYYQF